LACGRPLIWEWLPHPHPPPKHPWALSYTKAEVREKVNEEVGCSRMNEL